LATKAKYYCANTSAHCHHAAQTQPAEQHRSAETNLEHWLIPTPPCRRMSSWPSAFVPARKTKVQRGQRDAEQADQKQLETNAKTIYRQLPAPTILTWSDQKCCEIPAQDVSALEAYSRRPP
jgi:hypothetical protein